MKRFPEEFFFREFFVFFVGAAIGRPLVRRLLNADERCSPLQCFIKVIQDPFFIAGPEGGNQILFGAVAGDAMDHHFWRYFLEAGFQPMGIFF